MAVRHAGLEAGGVAGAKDGLALVLDQHELAFEHDDELVLVLVPVPLRGRRAGLQPHEVDAELRQPGRIAERLKRAALDRLGIGPAGSRSALERASAAMSIFGTAAGLRRAR